MSSTVFALRVSDADMEEYHMALETVRRMKDRMYAVNRQQLGEVKQVNEERVVELEENEDYETQYEQGFKHGYDTAMAKVMAKIDEMAAEKGEQQ